MADNSSGNTWMPAAGGILSAIVGVFDLLGSFGLFLWALFRMGSLNTVAETRIPRLTPAFLLFLAVILGILGILALVGGIFALRRKSWGLALTGAIASALPLNILGILAVVFVALGKKEF